MLQERSSNRGLEQTEKVDVRVILATTDDLAKEDQAGRFGRTCIPHHV